MSCVGRFGAVRAGGYHIRSRGLSVARLWLSVWWRMRVCLRLGGMNNTKQHSLHTGRMPRIRHLREAVIHRWPALLGAALVTAAVPTGMAFALPGPGVTQFPGGIWAGPSYINSTPTSSNSIALNVTSVSGNAIYTDGTIEAHGRWAIDAQGTAMGVNARATDAGASAVHAEGSKYGVDAVANTAVHATGSDVGVDSSGSTIGVKASSTSGTGVQATSGSGTAIEATSKGTAIHAYSSGGKGLQANGTTVAVQAYVDATGSDGVDAFGERVGVYAEGRTAIQARSYTGVGGEFSGAEAPIRLMPAATPGAPTSSPHHRGELYVDSAGALYLCITDGTPGTWKKVHLDN
jgi:hypothetical protein